MTPVFRRRLNEKFNRGAENQSFLVESITGIETLKAMAVEPQMQRRWEEQLAGYVKASFRVLNLGNWASQGVQLTSKLVTAAVLFFGAKAVINGDMTVGELVAFNMLASRVSQPVLRLAQVWQDFHQARLSVARLGDICRWRLKRVPKWRRTGTLPGEPFGVSLSLVLGGVVQNGPKRSRARHCWARRSEPLTARTVLR